MEKHKTRQSWQWWWRLICSEGLWSGLPPEMMAAIYDMIGETMFISQEDLPLVITTSGKYMFLEDLHFFSAAESAFGIYIDNPNKKDAAIRICADNVEVNGCDKKLSTNCLGISVESAKDVLLCNMNISFQDRPVLDFRRVVIGNIAAEKRAREREILARCKAGKPRREKGRRDMARDNGRIKQKRRLLPRW